jgi:hypothetical protein
MVAALVGVAGLPGAGPDRADVADVQGGTADPRHAQPGELAPDRRAWADGPPGAMRGPYGLPNWLPLIGWDPVLYTAPAGELKDSPTADEQPLTRAAPWPAGMPASEQPADNLPWLAQSAQLRSVGFGAERVDLWSDPPVQDTWLGYDTTGPGSSLQVPVPDQVKSGPGWASRDRVQSNAPQNAYTFDERHQHRRVAIGAIPGNYDWLEPGSRPLLSPVPRVGTAVIASGADSPFAGQVGGDAWSTHGALLRTLPGPYSPPPAPAVAGPVEFAPVPSIGFW